MAQDWSEREQRLMREALFRSAVLVRRMVPQTVGNMEAQVEQTLAMPLAEQLHHEVRREEAIEYGAQVLGEDLQARRDAMEREGIAERMRSDAAKRYNISDLRRRAHVVIDGLSFSDVQFHRDTVGVLRELLSHLPPADNCGND